MKAAFYGINTVYEYWTKWQSQMICDSEYDFVEYEMYLV